MPMIVKKVESDPGGELIPKDQIDARNVDDFKRGVLGCASVVNMKRPKPGIIAARCRDRHRRDLGWHILTFELPEPEYPEHEKLKKVKDQSQACGDFLEWLQDTKGIVLAKRHEHVEGCEPNRLGYGVACGMTPGDLEPCPVTVRKLLAEFFSIDEDKLEQEKQDMLERIRDPKQD